VTRTFPWPVLFLLAAGLPASAQQDARKLLEEERRKAMDGREETEADAKPFVSWDAGGWIHLEAATLDDEPEERERTYRYVDLRVWGELRLDTRHVLYVRALSDYVDFNSGDQFEGEDDDEVRPFYLDQAWFRGEWEAFGGTLGVRGGRAFFTLGKGLLFNQVAYGMELSYREPRWSVRALGAHSILHDDDIDQSLPNSDDSRRGFAAVEVEGLITGRHRGYAIAMIERDFNEEDPEVAGQDWTYDAAYFALGFRGSIWRGLGYAVEGVYETGESVAAGSTESEPIGAWAFLATLDCVFDGVMEPTFALEYLYGSGDADRGSVTDVAAGNRAGTDDEGFLSFGFVQTGFSLFPRVSNIHILRFGGSLRPLADWEPFRKLELGAYYYWYRKAEAESPISDPRSSENNEDVGMEFDLLLRWRIYSDLGLSLTFGRFLPGDAYPDDADAPRNFFSAGLTVSF
jgi:hypothetical protein